MNEFIERNRRLLYFHCKALRIIGSLILIFGLVSGCATTILVLLSKIGIRDAPNLFYAMFTWPSSFLNFIFFGIGVLGLGQFIRYLIDRNYKPGWILRHGEIILYLYALLYILNEVWFYTNASIYGTSSFYTLVFVILATAFSRIAIVLILIGLGQILRHLLPVIEESKTLV
jgi:hypothetical protein